MTQQCVLTPGVLCPALVEPSAQERHGPVGVGPQEGHRNDPRDGEPLLCGKAERVGTVQPGEEEAWERPSCGLSVPKEAYKIDGTDFLSGPVAIEQGVMILN